MPRCRCSDKSSIVIMATKENLPTKQSRSANTPTGEESKVPAQQQPSGLGELATSMAAKAEKRLEVVQRAQISPQLGSEKVKESQDMAPKRHSPSPATRPRRYALELWVEIEIWAGMYAPPDEETYSVGFAIDALNRAYLVCTWGKPATWWPFMGKRPILKPASSTMKLWWLAKPSWKSPLGWDILLDGERSV